MNRCYYDILDNIGSEPLWFDEHAVPRFCEFSPDEVGNIYAREAVLAEIRCQGCGHPFKVAFSLDQFGAFKRKGRMICHEIADKTLHYGDPPNIECCAAGPTMNSEPVRVLEYWHRNDQKYVEDGKVTDIVAYMEWLRDPAYEIDITPDWVKAGNA